MGNEQQGATNRELYGSYGSRKPEGKEKNR